MAKITEGDLIQYNVIKVCREHQVHFHYICAPVEACISVVTENTSD